MHPQRIMVARVTGNTTCNKHLLCEMLGPECISKFARKSLINEQIGKTIRFSPIIRPGTKGGSATVQAITRHREVTDEGDCGDRSGCGNGRGEVGGAARAAGGDKRRRCSDLCVG